MKLEILGGALGGSISSSLKSSNEDSYVVGKSILGNIDGSSTENTDELERQRQAEIEAEIKRNIAEAKAKLAEAQGVYDHLIKELEEVYSRVSSVKNSLISLEQAVSTATENSHIGASQFNAAVDSAIQKCETAESTLASFGVSGGGGSGTLSASISSSNTIRVTPEILHAAGTIESANKAMVDLSNQLVPEMVGMGQEARDITMATERIQQFSKDLLNGGIWLFRAQLDIRYVYKKYHELQEEAIRRAMAIPS